MQTRSSEGNMVEIGNNDFQRSGLVHQFSCAAPIALSSCLQHQSDPPGLWDYLSKHWDLSLAAPEREGVPIKTVFHPVRASTAHLAAMAYMHMPRAGNGPLESASHFPVCFCAQLLTWPRLYRRFYATQLYPDNTVCKLRMPPSQR